MLALLPFKTFLEWKEYDKIDPIGGQRGDWQAASICSVLTNIAAARAGTGRLFTPRDWLLSFKDATEAPKPEERVAPPPRQSWQEQKMIGMMWAAASNAPKKKRKR